MVSTIDLPDNNDYDYISPQTSAIENVNSMDSQDLYGDNIYIDPIPGPNFQNTQGEIKAARMTRQTALLYTLCVLMLLLIAAVVGLGVYVVSRNHPLISGVLIVCLFVRFCCFFLVTNKDIVKA